MTKPSYNVLFLRTGNSARSIMAESIMNRLGDLRFHAFSAGSQPKGKVHPYPLDLLNNLNYRTGDLHSKSWEEFAARAPRPSTSYSPFATKQPRKLARCGRVSR